jgi:hypothetical protein
MKTVFLTVLRENLFDEFPIEDVFSASYKCAKYLIFVIFQQKVNVLEDFKWFHKTRFLLVSLHLN